MSTTFDVYPRTRDLPTFATLIQRSTEELHLFLKSIGIHARPHIHVRLQRNKDHSHVPFSLDEPMRWGRDTYAWFMVGNAVGGTDANYYENAAWSNELWDSTMFEEGPKYKQLGLLIRECVAVGHRWSFRRSAGQPAIINLTYGLIAGSLAAITDGFIYSDDGAWNFELMPALPDEFLKWYFRPETAEESRRDWTKNCIGGLAEELGDYIN